MAKSPIILSVADAARVAGVSTRSIASALNGATPLLTSTYREMKSGRSVQAVLADDLWKAYLKRPHAIGRALTPVEKSASKKAPKKTPKKGKKA